ncbi:MAG: hypothetical protein H7Y88_04685 [Phycisphaerales bacterium]|nr:hypothetical protein [Phycisphaerales bacterium]
MNPVDRRTLRSYTRLPPPAPPPPTAGAFQADEDAIPLGSPENVQGSTNPKTGAPIAAGRRGIVAPEPAMLRADPAPERDVPEFDPQLRPSERIQEASVTLYVNEDRACIGCGYNLKGLKVSGKCPECGRAIRKAKVSYSAQQLVRAPLGYLTRLRFASTLLLWGFIGLVASLIMYDNLGEAKWLFATCAAGFMQWLGVVIATVPRPLMPGATVNPVKEMALVRLAARVTQACWVPAAGALIAYHSPGAAGNTTAFLWIAQGLGIIALLGLVPFAIYMKWLADWGEDSPQSSAWQMCCWSEPFMFPFSIATASWAIRATNLLVESLFAPFLLLVGLAAFTFVILPLWLSLKARIGLYQVAHWAVKNHVIAEEKDERLRERYMKVSTEAAIPRDDYIPVATPTRAKRPEGKALKYPALPPRDIPNAPPPGVPVSRGHVVGGASQGPIDISRREPPAIDDDDKPLSMEGI